MSSRRNREITFLVFLSVGLLFARPAPAPDEPHPGQFHSLCSLTTVDGGIAPTRVADLHLDRHGQAVVLLESLPRGSGIPKILRVPPDSGCYLAGGVFPPFDALEISASGVGWRPPSYAEMAPSNPLTGLDHAVIIALEENRHSLFFRGQPPDLSPVGHADLLYFFGLDDGLSLAEVNYLEDGEEEGILRDGYDFHSSLHRDAGPYLYTHYSYTLDGRTVALVGLGSWNEILRAVAVQRDGDVLLAGTSFKNVLTPSDINSICQGNDDPRSRCRTIMRTLSRRHSPETAHWVIRVERDDLDDVDRSFGTDGRAILGEDYNEYGDEMLSPMGGGWHIGIQSSARIVVQRRGVLQRLNKDGSIDPSFGSVGDGIVRLPLEANDMMILPSGKILVAGAFRPLSSSNSKIAVARFNADGTPDLSFGFLGIATGIRPNGSLDTGSRANAIAVDSSGRIVLCGELFDERRDNDADVVEQMMTLVRFNPDGGIDPSFSYEGPRNAALLHVSDCAVEEGDMILVAGSYNHHRDRGGKAVVTEEAFLVRFLGRSPPGNLVPDVIRRSRSHQQRSVGPGTPPSSGVGGTKKGGRRSK